MKRSVLVFFVLVLFMGVFVSAGFNVGTPSNSIDTEYTLGAPLRGWINISLTDVSIASILSSSFGGSFNLIDFLFQNGVSPSCLPIDCESDYSIVPGSEKTSDEFVLNDGESKILGFKIDQIGEGKGFIGVNQFELNITSNSSRHTKPQLHIELVKLDDNLPEWSAYKSSGNYYGESGGCYDSNPTAQANIGPTKYCNKISIPPSPKIEVGANIVNNLGGSATFSMSVDEVNGDEIGTCGIPNVVSPGRIFCEIDLRSSEVKDYHVCISTGSGTDKYKINYEQKNVCGFSGDFAGIYNIDFDVFAKLGEYEKVGSFILDDLEIGNYGNEIFTDIEEEMDSYINQKYGNDCSGGCVIPLKITSGINNQKINISDISINYDSEINDDIFELYDVIQTSAVMSIGFNQLDIGEANFSVPNSFGNHSLELYIDDDEILSKYINIEKVPQILSLYPLTAPAAFPQKFIINAQSADENTTITKYEWDFGEGGLKQTTSTNITEHTYTSVGSFKLNITVTDSNLAKSTKTFNIVVKNPKETVDEELPKKVASFERIKSFIESQSLFYQNSIKTAINFNAMEGLIGELQQRSANAVSDSDYVSIMSDLIDLQIPNSINITESANGFLFYTDREKVNMNILSEIGGETYNIEREDLYLDAIVSWNLNNLVSMVNFKSFSGIYDDYIDELVSIVEINIDKNSLRDSSLIIIPKLDGLVFKEDYSQKEKSDHYYIELTSAEKNVGFSTTEEIDITNLPIFISPRIGQFSKIIEFTAEDRKELSRRTLLILSILLIIFLGFVIYFMMQVWYKKKYEGYLFRNKNDLYNMVLFVQNSKKRGVDPREIERSLRKSGWSYEQIKYVMRKYVGKRTGVPEIIPIKKFFNLFNRGKTPVQENRPQFSRQPNRFIGNTKI